LDLSVLCSDLAAQDKTTQKMYFGILTWILQSLCSAALGRKVEVHLERTAHSILIDIDGFVFVLDMHNSSGWEGTILFNSTTLNIGIVYAILSWSKHLGGMDFVKQMTNDEIQRSIIRFSCVGDDNVMCSDKGFRIPIDNYVAYLQECGWDAEATYTSFEHTTFLGHRPYLVRNEGETYMLPVLYKSRITSIPKYGKKGDSIQEVFARAYAARLLAFPYALNGDIELFALLDLYCDYLFLIYKEDPQLSSIPLRKTCSEMFSLYTGEATLYSFRRQIEQIWIMKRQLLSQEKLTLQPEIELYRLIHLASEK